MKVADVRVALKGFWARALVLLAIVFALSLVGGCTFRVMFVNWIDNWAVPYKFDSRTGKIERLPHVGYVVTPPLLVSVHYVDARPMQVCISAIQRVLNCKLVQFTPDGMGVDENEKPIDGLKLFLKWHGRADYSNEGGTRENPTVLNQILMAYAYEGSGKNYPFLTVIRELKPEEIRGTSVPPEPQR